MSILKNRSAVPLLCGWALAVLLPMASSGAEVSMAFGEKIPPFCFPETDSGIEIEIIREALAFRGHVLKPAYYPFARIPIAFKAGSVDAAMTDLGENMDQAGGYYGEPAVFYDNVFITLKERNVTIKTPADLRGLTVIAFPGAARRYPLWLDDVKKAGRYFEQNNQSLQVMTLNAGHYDVALSDRSIFRYFSSALQKTKDFRPKPVVMHSFVKMNPQDYRPVFRDPVVRDDFNAGLRQLKAAGRVNAIYKKYLGDQQD
ncbi:MAG: ABC transporter substrate-binding protein [Pseudomonadota bacterium]